MPMTTGAVSLLGARPGVWRQRATRPSPTYRGRAARVVRVDAGVKYKRNEVEVDRQIGEGSFCLLYTSPSPRDRTRSRMPSSA